MMTLVKRLAVIGAIAAVHVSDIAAQTGEYSAGIRANAVPNQLLWGDTHLHTRLSPDAYVNGTETFTPEMALRFARGETVTSTSGVKAALRVPLDFLVVADHAEFLGLFAAAADRNSGFLQTTLGQRWRHYLEAGDIKAMFAEYQGMVLGNDPDQSTEQVKIDIWRSVCRIADAFNQPGVFSALIGYEWSATPDSNNLHRNVIYKDGADRAGQLRPFSATDSIDPEDLWGFLERYEHETGGEVLAIPHNGNLSNGLMFAPENFDHQPLTEAYARARSRWEPIYEVTQIKGDGETHPFLSPGDDFADYETWDTGNFPVGATARKKEDWMLQYEYARSALKLGLAWRSRLGVNPFRFGMIGSSDAHTGLAAVAEDNFFGKFVESEPSPRRLNSAMKWLKWPNAMITASGLAAVWARENTREEIFAAMKRREVYATTGSRIRLRLFGGWDFSEDDAYRSDYVDIGYAKGVPMGSGLTAAPAGRSAQFMVIAAKDPDEANLDRIQIIKGWLDADGALHEKVYDVALSDGRKADAKTGQAPPLASTVDVGKARYLNSVGESVLATVWTDPDFDRTEAAFYYARVLEIPKPRWTAYDASFFDQVPGEGIQLLTQDRAYSSPIWYQP